MVTADASPTPPAEYTYAVERDPHAELREPEARDRETQPPQRTVPPRALQQTNALGGRDHPHARSQLGRHVVARLVRGEPGPGLREIETRVGELVVVAAVPFARPRVEVRAHARLGFAA